MHLKVDPRQVFGGCFIDRVRPGKPAVWTIGYVVEAMEMPRWISFPISFPIPFSLKTFAEARVVRIRLRFFFFQFVHNLSFLFEFFLCKEKKIVINLRIFVRIFQVPAAARVMGAHRNHRPINMHVLRLGMPLHVVFDRDNWFKSEAVFLVSANKRFNLILDLNKHIRGLPRDGDYELRMVEWIAKKFYQNEICAWPNGPNHAH